MSNITLPHKTNSICLIIWTDNTDSRKFQYINLKKQYVKNHLHLFIKDVYNSLKEKCFSCSALWAHISRDNHTKRTIFV
jgi:hypothetical protein